MKKMKTLFMIVSILVLAFQAHAVKAEEWKQVPYNSSSSGYSNKGSSVFRGNSNVGIYAGSSSFGQGKHTTTTYHGGVSFRFGNSAGGGGGSDNPREHVK